MATDPSAPEAAKVLQIADQHVWVMAKGYAPEEGGMQTYAAGVAEAYARMGARVTVFTQTSRGPRREQTGSAQLVDVGAGGGPGLVWRLIKALRKECKTTGIPLVVHGTTWRTSILPLVLRLNYFTTFHGREFMLGNAAAKGILRLVARNALLVVTVSKYSAGKLRQQLGFGAAPVVAYNGVSLQQVNNEPGHTSQAVPLLFSLCRLEPRKNIAACIRACAKLKERGHSFRYIIAGRGPELQTLRALVTELGLDQDVQLVGYVCDADTISLHQQTDIFLHPQIETAGGRDFEGFGIVIADAMASRSAVIVGKDGGAAELVEHGVTGLTVDGHSNDALVGAIELLLGDTELRTRMAEAAQRHAREKFSWDGHAAIILQALAGKLKIPCPSARQQSS